MARRRGSSFVNIRIDVDAKKTLERLGDIDKRLDDFDPVFRWAKRELERAYSNNFTTLGLEGARAMLKNAWPPLDAEYASWKARTNPGATTLMGPTRSLFRSVSDLAESPRNRVNNTRAEFFVDNPIAKFHQHGTQNMPARRIVFTPRDFDQDIGKKVAKYVVDGRVVGP